MISILLSINKPHTDNIKALIKKIEVRKSKPNCELPFKGFIYETKHNGGCKKVIGEFICDEIYHIKNYGTRFSINNDERLTNGVARASCLNFDDMKNYLKDKDGYAWHITDLVIYETPKELTEFKTKCREYGSDNPNCTECNYYISGMCYEYDESDCGCNGLKPITRPPQSWCYVKEIL